MDISYLLEKTNNPMIVNIVRAIIKNNHIFNNITITFRPKIIKVFPKLDVAIIWLDIWDIQSRSKPKGPINRCFNIKSYIMTIQESNINLRVSQYKNCWKWGHTTFVCRVQESKCIKCNGLYKTEHYYYCVWYCKVNFKINLLRLETKQSELYLYMFKCLNCKGNHQVDSNQCSFWKHCFNRK